MKWIFSVFFILILMLVSDMKAQMQFQIPVLEKQYPDYRYCNVELRKLKHNDVVRMLQELKTEHSNTFNYEKIGTSVKGKEIFLVRMGNGPTRLLLWSQMHGDEPTATAALFDVFNYLLKRSSDTLVKTILENTTLLAVPMLNPDGAENFKRRNAQDIDINRDARDLQTPEGRILFNLKEKYQPDFGFNLHDQDARRTVGSSNKLAAIALMAPPFDAGNIDNAVRIRAKKIVSVIYQALGTYLYGNISKYDADYMPRAFGDSMQNWGVSTILIESGGWYKNRDDFLQKMNFIAMMCTFKAIADGSYDKANPAIYETLEENGKSLYDFVIRDVNVLDGTGIPHFSADIAINFNDKGQGKIEDIGDLNYFTAIKEIDGRDLYLSPGFAGYIGFDNPDEATLLDEIKSRVKQGYTTILLPVHVNGDNKRLLKMLTEHTIPVNVASVLHLDNNRDIQKNENAVYKYILNNRLGLIAGDTENVNRLFTDVPKINTITPSEFEVIQNFSTDAGKIKELTSVRYKKINMSSRGRIVRGNFADLVLFKRSQDGKTEIHSVYVKGHPVYIQGREIDSAVKGEYWF